MRNKGPPQHNLQKNRGTRTTHRGRIPQPRNNPQGPGEAEGLGNGGRNKSRGNPDLPVADSAYFGRSNFEKPGKGCASPHKIQEAAPPGKAAGLGRKVRKDLRGPQASLPPQRRGRTLLLETKGETEEGAEVTAR